jgi:hypothetical protein
MVKQSGEQRQMAYLVPFEQHCSYPLGRVR